MKFRETETLCIPLTKESSAYSLLIVMLIKDNSTTLLSSYESLAQTTLFTITS